MGKSSHWGDLLLSHIEFCRGSERSLVRDLTDLVHLLVHLGTVMVTVLSSPGNGERNTGRMPCSDTSNLTQTPVSLPGKTSHTPTCNHALITVTPGDSNDVNHLILVEDGVHGHALLEQLVTEVHLVSDGTTVDLNLNQMSLLLLDTLQLTHLCVSQHTDNASVLLHPLQVGLQVLLALLRLIPLRVLGESFLLRLVPVLVEPPLKLVAQVLSPDGVQRPQTTRSLHVRHQSDDNHGRSLNDGHGLACLLLVQLGSGLLHLSHDVSHTSLVAEEGGQAACLLRVISGESFHLSSMTFRPLAGQESERTVTGMLELPVRHGCDLSGA